MKFQNRWIFNNASLQFRNQYDNDVTVWSPQGRIHQLEYAMEAVKQGSATVGLKSKTHAILIALKRAPSELSAYQKKVVPIDDHCGVAVAGLTADARLLWYVGEDVIVVSTSNVESVVLNLVPSLVTTSSNSDHDCPSLVTFFIRGTPSRNIASGLVMLFVQISYFTWSSSI